MALIVVDDVGGKRTHTHTRKNDSDKLLIGLHFYTFDALPDALFIKQDRPNRMRKVARLYDSLSRYAQTHRFLPTNLAATRINTIRLGATSMTTTTTKPNERMRVATATIILLDAREFAVYTRQ